MTDRELMQQALEALLEVNYDQAYAKEVSALRERLAQPEQETAAKAWDEGYWQGVEDECISAANIGAAGKR